MNYNNAFIGNHISYSGKVKASLSVNGSKVQVALLNSGTKYLWDTIAMAFAGGDISNRIPKYLDIVDNNSTSLLLGRVMFRGIVWGDVVTDSDKYSAVRFTATVTSADKRNTRASSGCHLRMYSVSARSNEYLAEIKDSDNRLAELYNSIDVGSDAIFEWELHFQNQTTEEDK